MSSASGKASGQTLGEDSIRESVHSGPESAPSNDLSSLPLVTIIVLNFRGRSILPRCVESIGRSKYSKYELIVVDNSPDDGGWEASKDGLPQTCPTYYLPMKTNAGFCEGFNVGLERARGKYVLMLNNDTEITEDSVKKLVDFMECHPEVGLCEGRIENTGERYRGLVSNPDIASWAGVFAHWGNPAIGESEFNSPREVFSAIGVWPFIRMSVLEEIGPYDSDFFIAEEIRDLCWRIWLRGYTVVHIPSATVRHIARLAIVTEAYGLSIKKANLFHESKNSVQILLKNLSDTRLLYVLPLNLLIRLIELFWLLTTGQGENARVKVGGYIWVIHNLDAILRKRRDVQAKIRRVSDRQALAALRHMNPLSHVHQIIDRDVFLGTL
jgi:hypothetical protein